MSKDWFWQIFKFEGTITNIFISKKKRKSNPLLFAFVHFERRSEPLRAMENLDSAYIRGNIIVKEAEYKRGGKGIVIEEHHMQGGKKIKSKLDVGSKFAV